MGQIDSSRCFVLAKGAKTSITEVGLPVDWPAKLAHICANALNISSQEKDKLEKGFNKHAGPNSTYRSKAQLLEQLQDLLARLMITGENAMDDSAKSSVAFKLKEGAGQCTPGFHNRVNDIVAGFYYPDSLDALLTQFRTTIVDATARQNIGAIAPSMQIHTHNRFFIVAAVRYGVEPVNKDDPHSELAFDPEIDSPGMGIPDEIMLDKIGIAFEQHYQPAMILNTLLENIKGVLHTQFGYAGQSKSGYASGEYLPFFDYLRTLFGADLEYSDYLMLNDEGHVYELNWHKIKQTLFNTLDKQTYFQLSDEERHAMHALLHEIDEEPLESNQAALLTDGLVRNRQEFIHFIDFLGIDVSFAPFQKFVKAYLASSSPSDRRMEMLKVAEAFKHQQNHPIFKALKNIAHEENTKILKDLPTEVDDPVVLMAAIKKIINKQRAWVLKIVDDEQLKYVLLANDEYHENVLMHAVRHGHPQNIESIVSAILDLEENVQERILTHVNLHGENALIIAIKHHPEVVDCIMNALHTLKPEQRTTILNQVNNEGDDAFQTAVLTANRRVVKSLLTAIWEIEADEHSALSEQAIWHRVLKRQIDPLPEAKKHEALIAIGSALKQNPQLHAALKEYIAENAIHFLKVDETHADAHRIIIKTTQNILDKHDSWLLRHLSHDELVKALTLKDGNGRNAFMHAIYTGNQEAVADILNAIEALDPEKRRAILTQVDDKNINAVMLAAAGCPNALDAILKAIKKWHPDEMIGVLKQRDQEFKGNALIWAIEGGELTAISSILAAARECGLNALADANAHGENALMLAIQWRLKEITQLILIDEFPKLDSESKKVVLTQTNQTGLNALHCALHAKNQQTIEAILAEIATLDIDKKTKIQILTQMARNGENPFIYALETDDSDAIRSILNVTIKLQEDEPNIDLADAPESAWLNAIQAHLDPLPREQRPLALLNVGHEFRHIQTAHGALKKYVEKNDIRFLHEDNENMDMKVHRKMIHRSENWFLDLYHHEELADILTQTDEEDENLLQFAVKTNNQTSIKALLSTASRLGEDTLIKMVTNEQAGNNCLTQALRHNRKAVGLILEALNSLSPEKRNPMLFQLLNQPVNRRWQNTLMMCLESTGYDKQALNAVLKSMSQLTEDEQLTIFLQKDSRGKTPLQLALDNVGHIEPILKAIKQLSPEKQTLVLTQTNMLAQIVQQTPMSEPALNAILNATHRLAPDKQKEFLCHTNADGENLLLLAIRHNRAAIAPIFAAVERLEPEVRQDVLKRLLTQISNLRGSYSPYEYFESKPRGENALLRILKSSPSATVNEHIFAILKAMNELNINDNQSTFVRIFTELEDQGLNAMAIAEYRKHDPNILAAMLKWVVTFPADKQKAALTNQYANAIHFAIDRLPQSMGGIVDAMATNLGVAINLYNTTNLQQRQRLFERMLSGQKKHFLLIQLGLQLADLIENTSLGESLPFAQTFYAELAKKVKEHENPIKAIMDAMPLLRKHRYLMESTKQLLAQMYSGRSEDVDTAALKGLQILQQEEAVGRREWTLAQIRDVGLNYMHQNVPHAEPESCAIENLDIAYLNSDTVLLTKQLDRHFFNKRGIHYLNQIVSENINITPALIVGLNHFMMSSNEVHAFPGVHAIEQQGKRWMPSMPRSTSGRGLFDGRTVSPAQQVTYGNVKIKQNRLADLVSSLCVEDSQCRSRKGILQSLVHNANSKMMSTKTKRLSRLRELEHRCEELKGECQSILQELLLDVNNVSQVDIQAEKRQIEASVNTLLTALDKLNLDTLNDLPSDKKQSLFEFHQFIEQTTEEFAPAERRPELP